MLQTLWSALLRRRNKSEGESNIQFFRLAYHELKFWECWTNTHINVCFGEFGLPLKTRVFEIGDAAVSQRIEKLRGLGYREIGRQKDHIVELLFATKNPFDSVEFSEERAGIEDAVSELLSWFEFGEWIGGAIQDGGFETAFAVRDPEIAEFLVREHLCADVPQKLCGFVSKP